MQADRSDNLGARSLVSIRELFASKRTRHTRTVDLIYRSVLLLASSIIFVLILAIIWKIYSQSELSIKHFGAKFLTSTDWDAVEEKFGLKNLALGTLYCSFWALLIAVPVSIGTAVFLSEMAPRWLAKPLTFLIELLAAVPSIVYGLWGILVLVPWLVDRVETPISESPRWGTTLLFNAAPNGNDYLSASLVLALMVIPIITGIARDILKAVPRSMREASYALGATRWETIRTVVLRHARSGIVGAVILGLGRALGETMAVTMLIGNNPDFHWPLFSPGYTMSAMIANEFTEATTDLYKSSIMEVALALLVIAIIVNALARLLVRITTKPLKVAA